MLKTLRIMWEIYQERRRQNKLYGRQDYDQLHWLSIETEEFGEVGKAVYEAWHNGASLANARKEWKHVAAVAAAAIENLDWRGE